MPRKKLPISQRHRPDCTQPRECACPWSARVRLPDGTMRRVTRDSYADAEQAYYELMARRPEPLADRTTTIEQWARRWLATGAAEWRPATQQYRNCGVPKHILPDLGPILMTELRRDDVRAWVARMRDRGTRPVAMLQAVQTLHAMYGAWLADDRILPRGNPVPRGVVKKAPRKEFTPLTTAQVTAWAAAMPPDMKLIVEVEAFYGGRMSEILALREEDVTFTGLEPGAPLAPQLARLADLPAEKYEARKPRLRFQRKQERDGSSGPIKNHRGNRTVPLPQWLAAAFAAQFEKWPPCGGCLFVNRRTQSGAYGQTVRQADVAAAAQVAVKTVAHTLAGRKRQSSPAGRRIMEAAARLGYGQRKQPFRPSAYADTLAKAAAKAGITLPPNQCTHALRHHCVSVLRDKGWPDQDIGYWIGDTARTVADVYGRPAGDAMHRIAAELSSARSAPRLRAVE